MGNRTKGGGKMLLQGTKGVDNNGRGRGVTGLENSRRGITMLLLRERESEGRCSLSRA